MIDLPPGQLGVLDDMCMRYVTGVGVGVGEQDKGTGRKCLVLPPGCKGDVPEGYFIARPRSYSV